MALLCLGANEGVVPSLRDGWLVAGALVADDVQFARHEAGLLEIEVGIDDISPTGCIRSLSRAVYHDDDIAMTRRRSCTRAKGAGRLGCQPTTTSLIWMTGD